MTKMLLIVGVLSLAVFTTSCGGGSKSGAGSYKSVEDVNYCIDYRVVEWSLETVVGFDHDITNTCDFDVNIGVSVFGLDTGTIPAGQTIHLQGVVIYFESPIPFIACRPPSVPFDTKEDGPPTGKGLICIGG